MARDPHIWMTTCSHKFLYINYVLQTSTRAQDFFIMVSTLSSGLPEKMREILSEILRRCYKTCLQEHQVWGWESSPRIHLERACSPPGHPCLHEASPTQLCGSWGPCATGSKAPLLFVAHVAAEGSREGTSCHVLGSSFKKNCPAHSKAFLLPSVVMRAEEFLRISGGAG